MKQEIEPGHTVAPMPSRFRKKPVVVEAHQWFKNGDHPDDYRDAVDGPSLDGSKWISFDPGYQNEHGWEGQVVRYYRHPGVPGDKKCEHCDLPMHFHGWIETLEGGHIVCPGDWVITGVKGERYPCKPDVFAATYEPAEEGAA